MDRFEVEEQQKYVSSYTRLDTQPSISQLSTGYQQKVELAYTFIHNLIGAYLFTFGIISSNDNFLGILLIYFFIILLSSKPTLFNPAVSMMECLQGTITVKELWISMIGQFLGCMFGAMTGYFFLSSFISKLPYWDSSLNNGIIAQLYGEVFGSAILLSVILIQDDDYLKFTDDNLEHGILLTATFGAARELSYKSNSLFNPFIAFSLELFESIQQGNFDRMSFVWIFMIGPYIGGMIALMFANQVYKNVYSKKIRNGI